MKKIFDMFLFFPENIDCGYTLELPRQGGSDEFPQSLFWNKNKKNKYIPANPSFLYIYKSGAEGDIFFKDIFS